MSAEATAGAREVGADFPAARPLQGAAGWRRVARATDDAEAEGGPSGGRLTSEGRG
jgi:hypothetical protein